MQGGHVSRETCFTAAGLAVTPVRREENATGIQASQPEYVGICPSLMFHVEHMMALLISVDGYPPNRCGLHESQQWARYRVDSEQRGCPCSDSNVSRGTYTYLPSTLNTDRRIPTAPDSTTLPLLFHVKHHSNDATFMFGGADFNVPRGTFNAPFSCVGCKGWNLLHVSRGTTALGLRWRLSKARDVPRETKIPSSF